MAILLQDGFAQYNTLESFLAAKGGAWLNSMPTKLTYNSAQYGGAEIKNDVVYSSQTMVSDLYEEGQQIVAFSFFMRTGTTATQNRLRIGLCPKSWRTDRLLATSSAPPIAFEFSVNGNSGQSISHNVPTAAAPSISVNSVVAASNTEALALNQVYHVQILIDIRNPAAIFKVFLNGVSYFDATFSRDRLVNGFQPLTMGSLFFLSGGVSAGVSISDLVAWRPDADHPFPSPKPLKIRYYAPSATLATPADEFTFVTVNTDTYANYAIPGSSVPANAEIIGAKAYVRMRAQDGASFANADIKLTVGGVDEQIVLEQTPSGFLSKLFSKQLTTAQSSVAAINAAIFKMRSPE